MDFRLFRTLADALAREPVVLASVVDTRGATPRKRGARMLVTAAHCRFSVGGGQAEAQVVAAARALLDAPFDAATGHAAADLTIELDGGPGAAGVCGGCMCIALRRCDPTEHAAYAAIAATLAAGMPAPLPAALSGADEDFELQPDVRLLIVGAGHCGAVLARLAAELDFDIHLFDERADVFDYATCADGVHCIDGDLARLRPLLDGRRRMFAVLLNRDYLCDVRTLAVLAERPPEFIGMMGSRRRIAEVHRALPALAERLAMLQAPVGLAIGAQTPAEIAISVLAQLIAVRAGHVTAANGDSG